MPCAPSAGEAADPGNKCEEAAETLSFYLI